MNEKRIFNLGNAMTLEEIARLLEQFLAVQKNLTTQKIPVANKIILQCVDADSHWKQFIGLDAALTIELEETPEHALIVTIGNGKWLDKLGTAAVGAIFFSPLIVAAGIGAVRQAVLPAEIFNFLETQTGTNYSRPNVSKTVSPEPEPQEMLICPCCGNQVSTTSAFCSQCGTKL